MFYALVDRCLTSRNLWRGTGGSSRYTHLVISGGCHVAVSVVVHPHSSLVGDLLAWIVDGGDLAESAV